MKNKSIEFFYVLFLISGYIKSYMNISNFKSSIDITLILGVILVIISFITIFKNNKISIRFKYPIQFLIIFYIWMFLTSLYTSSSSYWIQKSFYFLTNIIAFVFPLILYKTFDTSKFFKIFIFLTTVLNLYFIFYIFPYIYIAEAFYNLSGNYLFVSMSSGLNIMVLLILKLRYKSVFFSLLILVVNFFTMLSSGGRGGIIFTLLILSLYYIVKFINSKSFKTFTKKSLKHYVILFLVVVMGSLYLTTTNLDINKYFENSIRRLELLGNISSNQDMGNSINERINLINFSINKSFSNASHLLLGYGIGSFSYEYSGIDERGYPHNIILEILFEMGIIGLFLFLLFYLFIIKKYRFTPLIWLVLYMTLHALKSSSLVDLRLFFAILALMMINSTNKRISY